MTCNVARNLLDAFLDGELDLVRQLEIEHHLHDCQACADFHEGQVNLRTALQAGELYHRAPASLRERLSSEWGPAGGVRRPRVPASWRWAGLVVAAACIALLSWMLGRFSAPPGPTADEQLAEAVVVGHVRSLLERHLTDVDSNDRHEVKPWFAGKLDYSFTVPNLDEPGFPLLGGRMDYLLNRPVAALVYGRHKHKINLFLWPASGEPDRAMVDFNRHGYSLLHWTHAGMHYWAVSDVNETELRQFAELVHR